jgi:hypothetical protein
VSHVVAPAAGARIEIICATFNGAQWLPALVASLQAQTHRAWHLHLKDDGSQDSTVTLLRTLATADPERITVYYDAPQGQGAAASFGWLMARVAPTAQYVACADQDDVWLPDKLARSLAVLQDAEGDVGAQQPVLVHTDLEVVDAALRPIAPSFARYSGRSLRERSVRETIVGNVVTGCTMLLNRALLTRVLPVPPAVAMHDWWVACVAAVLGRTIGIPEPLVQYRQHGANAIGAREAVGAHGRMAVISEAWRGLARGSAVRRDIAAAAVQAGALVAHLGPALTPADHAFARAYAELPTLPWAARKRALAQLHWLPERGLLRNLGLVLRG